VLEYFRVVLKYFRVVLKYSNKEYTKTGLIYFADDTGDWRSLVVYFVDFETNRGNITPEDKKEYFWHESFI
jgi:hypothetical protein